MSDRARDREVIDALNSMRGYAEVLSNAPVYYGGFPVNEFRVDRAQNLPCRKGFYNDGDVSAVFLSFAGMDVDPSLLPTHVESTRYVSRMENRIEAFSYGKVHTPFWRRDVRVGAALLEDGRGASIEPLNHELIFQRIASSVGKRLVRGEVDPTSCRLMIPKLDPHDVRQGITQFMKADLDPSSQSVTDALYVRAMATGKIPRPR